MVSAMLLAAQLAACGNSASATASELRTRLTPEGATASSIDTVPTQAQFITSTWTVDTPWTLEKYSTWASTRLGREFKTVSSPNGAAFRRTSGGDMYTVTIEPQAHSSTRFVVTFVAEPF